MKSSGTSVILESPLFYDFCIPVVYKLNKLSLYVFYFIIEYAEAIWSNTPAVRENRNSPYLWDNCPDTLRTKPGSLESNLFKYP